MDGVASDACAGMHTRAMLNDGRSPRWAAKRGFQGVSPPGKHTSLMERTFSRKLQALS